MIQPDAKKQIIDELSKEFRGGVSIEEILDMFEQFVQVGVPAAEEDISGIESRLLAPINIIFNENSSKSDVVLSYPAFSQLEPFLKKVLYFQNRQKLYPVSKTRGRALSCTSMHWA